jgi:hypothetical protein
MPRVYESASQFSPQANTEPDLLVLEAAFMKNGKAQAVDNDLVLRLFNLGDNNQIFSDITFLSNPAINKKVSGGGVYYFVRINPELFDGSVEAKWFAKIKNVSFDPYPQISVHNATKTSERILLASEILHWILRKLGWPKVSVELTEEQIAECIDDVLTEYNRFLPKLKYGNITLVGGQNYYKIPECGRGILDVQFRKKEGNPVVSDPLFGRDYPRGSRIDFDNYVLSTSFFETLLKKTGQEPIWRWEPSDPLTLFINTGDYSRTFYKVSYCYVVDNRLEEINPSYHDLFKRMALTRAKMVLGEVREKFGNSIITPSGNVNINGDKLKTEAFEAWEKLREELAGLQIPMWPITG